MPSTNVHRSRSFTSKNIEKFWLVGITPGSLRWRRSLSTSFDPAFANVTGVVDGTHCPFRAKGAEFWSHKLKTSALNTQVSVLI